MAVAVISTTMAYRLDRANRISLRRLARTYLDNGDRLLDETDPFGAAVWYSEAALQENADRQREQVYQTRIGSTLRHAPRLVVTMPSEPDQSANFAVFVGDGRQLLTVALHPKDPALLLTWWNAETGEKIKTTALHHWNVRQYSNTQFRAETIVWPATAGRTHLYSGSRKSS